MTSLKHITSAVMILVGGVLPGAAAAYTFHGLDPVPLHGHRLQELGDSELASLNGRFVASGSEVVYFGLEMVSTWASPSGLSLSGGASLTLDRAATTIPMFTFVPTATIYQAQSAAGLVNTADRQTDNAGVRNASGLVQSIQVAGDHNLAENTLSVATLSEKPAASTSASRDNAQATAPSGATAIARIDAGRATVRLELPGQGVVEQAIRLGDSGGRGFGALQTIQTLGDFHSVNNSMQLSLLFKEREKVDQIRESVGVYLDSLRGL